MPAEPETTSDPAPPARRLSIRKKLAFALLVVAGLLLTAEGALRVAGYPRGIVRSFSRLWNPDQAHAVGLFRPGKHHVAYPAELAYDATINQLGLRGHALTIEKPKDTLRVLALGDSVTFGYYVSDAETWPATLEAQLRTAGRAVEVVNAGCGHFSMPDELRYYEERLARLHPDVVVLQFCTNDVSERELLRTPTLYQTIASGDGAKSNLLRQTALGEFQLLMAIRLKEAGRRRRGEWPPKSFPSAQGGEPATDERWARYERDLVALKARLDADKIPLLLIAFADLADVEAPQPPPYERRLAAMAQKHKIPFRGAWKAARATQDPKNLYHYPLDPHPSGAGNAVLAALAADLLTEQRLLR